MKLTRVARAAAASVTLVLAGVVLRSGVVLPQEARARAELATLEAEDARRARHAAFETPDGDLTLATHREMDNLSAQFLELKDVFPETRDSARDTFLSNLRRLGAWSAELESLEWTERSRGGARYWAGRARVRIDPSGRGWLGTVRYLPHLAQRLEIGCVDVSDLSDPSTPVTIEVTLFAQPSDPWLMVADRPSAPVPGERGFRWADVFRRPPKPRSAAQDVAAASTAPVLASLERGECWGWCPVYSVVVHEDGIVDYEGREYVILAGRHRFRIGMDRVRELSAAFDAAGFGSFNANYLYAPGCRRGPMVRISYGGRVVHHQSEDEFAPPALARLEDEFDRIVGTDQWIGTDEEFQAVRSSMRR